MAKKNQREDTEIFLFTVKLVGALVLTLVIAAGVDISHAVDALSR